MIEKSWNFHTVKYNVVFFQHSCEKAYLDSNHCKVAKISNGFLFYYHQDHVRVKIILVNLLKWEIGKERFLFVWPDVRVRLQHESVEDVLLKLVISTPCVLSPQHPYAFMTRLKGFLEKKKKWEISVSNFWS